MTRSNAETIICGRPTQVSVVPEHMTGQPTSRARDDLMYQHSVTLSLCVLTRSRVSQSRYTQLNCWQNTAGKQMIISGSIKTHLVQNKHTERSLTAVGKWRADITPFSGPPVHADPAAVGATPVRGWLWFTLYTAVCRGTRGTSIYKCRGTHV